MNLNQILGGFATAARATREVFLRSRDRAPWKAVKTIRSWATAILATAAGIAGIYALVVYLQQRKEESNALLRGVEEALIFREFGEPLHADEMRSLTARLGEAYQKNPRSARVWALHGIYQAYISFQVDAYKTSALKTCTKALDLDGREPLGHLCTGIASLSSRDFKNADKHLKAVLKYQPNWPVAWYYHGRVLSELGRLKAAELALAKARSLDAPRPSFGIELAEFYFLHEKELDALSTLREVTGSTESPAARNALAIVLHYFGDTDNAINELSIAVKAAPTEPKFLTNMAALLNVSSRYEEALPLAVKALGLAPDSRHALVETVMALAGMKKYGPALHYSKKLLSVAPDFRWVRANQEFLVGKASGKLSNGIYMHTPPLISLCEDWTLSRFSDLFKKTATAMIADGKYVFPSDMAGRPYTGGGETFPLPKKESTVKVSCGSSNGPSIDPEWLSEQWEGKE